MAEERLRGNLPFAVEKMLESKHGLYDHLECDIKLTEKDEIELVMGALMKKKREIAYA